MAGRNLTKRQADALAYISSAVRDKGYFPSVREIGAALGVSSPATAGKHVAALVAKGALVREGSKTLLPRKALERGIPILGKVAAGVPTDSEQHGEGALSLADLFDGNDGLFAVRVNGDSMRDAGILDGDFVIVKPGGRPKSGDVVLAVLGPEGESTVKVLRTGKGGAVTLEPRNPMFEPIEVGEDEDFRIAGKVVGVVRNGVRG